MDDTDRTDLIQIYVLTRYISVIRVLFHLIFSQRAISHEDAKITKYVRINRCVFAGTIFVSSLIHPSPF